LRGKESEKLVRKECKEKVENVLTKTMWGAAYSILNSF
jgi:hypothetical protein